MSKISLFNFIAAGLFLPFWAFAHCPLCTAGAGAAAVGAAWLGVDSMVIGIFIGAFGLALGLWFSRLFKRKFIKFQGLIIGIISWLLTVLPLRPLLKDYTSIYISLTGDYGSLLNHTYLVDRFLVGSLVGALILVLAPYLSSFLAKKRGSVFPFQGIIITFSILLLLSLITQFFL